MPVMVRNYVAVLSNESPDAMRHNGKAVAILSLVKMILTFVVEKSVKG
jgi:hypothetical protein